MTQRIIPAIVVSLLGLVFHTSADAQLSMPHFFSDHMVIQRDKPAVIWGTADAGTAVKVNFAAKSVETTADAEGKWKVSLPAMAAKAKGTNLTVAAGGEKRILKDVLVGEVWFASGQSNMAFKVSASHQAAIDIAEADQPGIRMFLAARTPAAEPLDNIGGTWVVCSPQTVPNFSAVGYFFALNLHRELGIPVGIIHSSWGGKPVETFTSREALASIPEGKPQLDRLDKMTAAYDPKIAKRKHQAALVKYETALAEWNGKPQAERKRAPRKPALQRNPATTEGRPATLYNGMIHPFVGYAMRGAIWYQGEANAKTPASSSAYEKLFPLMITDWRKRWNDDFTFLWVQLANFKKPSSAPGVMDSWAQLQDVQRKCLSLPKSGMAVINDIGAANDIHPKNKSEVGRRLALVALAGDYGRDIIPGGPLYQKCTINGSEARVVFRNAEGLKSRDGEALKRFEIAGDDKVWHWADARIDGGEVIVSSPQVAKPAAVRYAWCSNPKGANLVNGEGLPTSVFRSDEWPID